MDSHIRKVPKVRRMARIRRNGAIRSLKSKFLFNSYFEEKKTLGYIRNLINSRFLNHKPVELFKFTSEVLGQKEIVSLLTKSYPEITEDEDFNEWIELDRLEEHIPNRILIKFLKEDASPLISRRLSRSSSFRHTDTERRLRTIQKTFNLLNEEVDILTFYYLIQTCPVVDDYLYGRDLVNFERLSTLRSHGHIILGLRRSSFLDAFSRGALFKAFILEVDNNTIDLCSWCTDYLSGLGKSDLSHDFFTLENDETLDVADFEISDEELMVLDTLIESRNGQNILFYGVPGTGKTSLARSLAKRYDRKLFTVKIPEKDEHRDRLRAIYATINLADKDNALILIDEADDVLNSFGTFFSNSKTSKSWINNFLDTHQQKIIWITNRTGQIEPSTMRRFTFSLEFKKFNAKNRLKVLRYELKKKGLGSYFTEEELNYLCNNYSVNADGIINAINILKIGRRTKKETALRKIKTVLKNHEKATVGRRVGNIKKREFKNFSLGGLNTSHSLINIISILQQYIRLPEKDSVRYNHSVSLLLYGAPGTGKTEFVYYLGNLLGREVLLKRCSEVQSMWVGQTEKNIAEAFQESQADNGILFFDEADSFLFPRKDADHSWEKSFTNEILTQLESYTGIVVFATNDIDGLDHAALRRFKFKIEFIPLTPEGNIMFYNSLLMPLVAKVKRLSTKEIGQIKGIQTLTPGDFAVVKVNPSPLSRQKNGLYLVD